MQIQKIQSSNRTFGYNPEANASLIHALEHTKKNKAFANYIKEIVTSTNNAEKELRKTEKELINAKNEKDAQKKNSLLGLLIASFLPIKIMVTDMINALMPKENYREQELASYMEESKERNLPETNPEHWVNKLALVFQEHEAEDQAQMMAITLKHVMKEQFPKVDIDISGLAGALKMQYLDNPEESDEVSDLEERIELGKSKVFHYEPTTENEMKGFASLGGMKELKETLMNDIVIPLKDPAKAKYNEIHYGIKRPNGILFYGPPGCGKTTIVERLSVETGLPLLELTTDSFGSEYINGSEINLGAVFDYAASIASEEKPVILFIDDVDGIVGNRNAFMHDHKKSELGVFLKRVQDAPKNNIIVMAATNNYDGIDKAFTSRLRQQIYTGLPDKEARKSIIKMKLEETDNGQNLAKDEKALDRIAELTENFPIRALEDFATETRKMAFVKGIRDITLEDYETVILKPESQNKKIKEENYMTSATRKSVGF